MWVAGSPSLLAPVCGYTSFKELFYHLTLISSSVWNGWARPGLQLLSPTYSQIIRTHGKSPSKLCKVICQTLTLMKYTEESVSQRAVCSSLCCFLRFLNPPHPTHCCTATPGYFFSPFHLKKVSTFRKIGVQKENNVLRRGRSRMGGWLKGKELGVAGGGGGVKWIIH